MPDSLGAGDMRLLHSKRSGNISLSKPLVGPHDRELGRQRKLGQLPEVSLGEGRGLRNESSNHLSNSVNGFLFILNSSI